MTQDKSKTLDMFIGGFAALFAVACLGLLGLVMAGYRFSTPEARMQFASGQMTCHWLHNDQKGYAEAARRYNLEAAYAVHAPTVPLQYEAPPSYASQHLVAPAFKECREKFGIS